MASWSERARWVIVALGIGCKPVLPATPPEEDPTNPDAPVADWKAPDDALSRSAFEGVKFDKGGHHGHGSKAKAETKKPESDEEESR